MGFEYVKIMNFKLLEGLIVYFVGEKMLDIDKLNDRIKILAIGLF